MSRCIFSSLVPLTWINATAAIKMLMKQWQTIYTVHVLDLQIHYELHCSSYVDCHFFLGTLLLFSCSLAQISNQPITWLQLSAFRYADVVTTMCWRLKWASEWEGKVTLNVARLLVPDRLVYFRNCWSNGIFPHNHVWVLQRSKIEVRERENIQWVAVLWMKMPC